MIQKPKTQSCCAGEVGQSTKRFDKSSTNVARSAIADALLGGYDCDDIGGEYGDCDYNDDDDDDEDDSNNCNDDDDDEDDNDNNDVDDNSGGRVDNGNDDDVSMPCFEPAVDEGDHRMLMPHGASGGESGRNDEGRCGVGGTVDANMMAVG